MFGKTRQILEMIRFSHTLFALPFALVAAVMAWVANARSESPIGFRWQELLGVLLCMVTARSAAMAFNRVADWRFDADNPRTKNRHIPAGTLRLQSVAGFAVGCSLAFVAATLLFLPNWLPLVLSLPVLAFLLGYSFAKRFTSLAHFWLGAALSLAPICAWIAIRGSVVEHNIADLLPSIVLAIGVMLWVAGFDMIYACQDAEFDLAIGLRSIPARLGVRNALRLAMLCHAAMIVALWMLPAVYPQLGWIYRGGLVAVAILLIYEHGLVRADDLQRVNVAFFNVNAVVSVGLFAVTSLDLWMGK